MRVFPIFRSNYENNLDRNIGPRERPKFSRHYGLNNDANVFSGGTKDEIQYTIYSVLDALERNPERRFNQVEITFFWRWWRKASQKDQEQMRAVIRSGQFNFLSGKVLI